MTKDELIERLKGYEWDDVEFKRARKGVPEDAYKTVSAYANTAGGWLIFGVKEAKGEFVVSGVEEVDKVQNDFLSCLRTGDKVNRSIDTRGSIHKIDDKVVLAFYIPELGRKEKPAYLKGDPRESYIRRGGGDERCTQKELERFLRDAAEVPYDAQVVEGLDPESFCDERALSWYRRMFNEKHPGRHEMLDDREFLREWNFVVEVRDKPSITRAALLLFGKSRHVRRMLSRPVVDFQIIHEGFEDWTPDHRWADRILVEDNIVQAWLAIVERYMKHADRPFEIDSATLRRHDAPPDYKSFREAAINLLIHQDYGETGRHAQIQIFRDRTRFWNPGNAFQSVDQLLEPGVKEMRNPNLVSAFQRIGLSDQAGTGIRAIFTNWRQLGNIPPQIVNHRDEKAFELTLLKEKLLSEDQQRFQKEIGVSLNENQATILAYACHEGQVSLTDAKGITGLTAGKAKKELESLAVAVLLKPLEPGRLYTLADQIRNRYLQNGKKKGYRTPENAVAENDKGTKKDQAGTKSALSRYQVEILNKCNENSSLLDLIAISGRSDRTKFRHQVLNPLIEMGLIEMTIPDKPRSSQQKYRLTNNGRQRLNAIKEDDE